MRACKTFTSQLVSHHKTANPERGCEISREKDALHALNSAENKIILNVPREKYRLCNLTTSIKNHCTTIVHLTAAINAFHNYTLSSIFVIPLSLVLCTAKSFVVISLGFEQLFKVRFAIKVSLQSSIISKSVTKKIKNYPITL